MPTAIRWVSGRTTTAADGTDSTVKDPVERPGFLRLPSPGASDFAFVSEVPIGGLAGRTTGAQAVHNLYTGNARRGGGLRNSGHSNQSVACSAKVSARQSGTGARRRAASAMRAVAAWGPAGECRKVAAWDSRVMRSSACFLGLCRRVNWIGLRSLRGRDAVG